MDLRRALARAGWRSHPWLLGMNGGAKANTMDLLLSRLDAIYDGQPDPARRLEPRRHVRPRTRPPLSRQDPRRRDAGLALFAATSRPTPMSANSTSGSRAMTSISRRSSGSAPSHRSRLWRYGRAATASSLPPPPAASLMRSTRRSRSTPTIWASRSSGPRFQKVVQEIRAFLTEVEGAAPVMGGADLKAQAAR